MCTIFKLLFVLCSFHVFITHSVSCSRLGRNDAKAINTPYEHTVGANTSTFRGLLENSKYNSTSEYKYDEKSELLNKSNSKTNKLNQPPEKLNLSRDHVGIIFSLYDLWQAKSGFKPPREDKDELLAKVNSTFRKVVILVHDVSPEGRRFLQREVKTLSDNQEYNFEITILILPGIHLSEIIEGIAKPYMHLATSSLAEPFVQKYLGPFRTYLFPYVGEITDKDVHYYRNIIIPILNRANISNYLFGYTFNISLCSSFDKLNVHDKKHFDQHMSAQDVRTIAIFFEESEENTKLGPDRMFNQTIALFMKCKNLLAERINRIEDIQISFVMLHYSINSKFYGNKTAILNFINYWQKLGDWAKQENTTVILNNAIDSDRRFKTRSEYAREPGWWKYQYGNVNKRIPSPTSRRNTFINKIEYVKWRSQRQTGIQAHELLLAIIVPIIIVALFVISATWCWKRLVNRKNILTKAEVNDFFKGKEHDNESLDDSIGYLPYDKNRYEVSSEAFAIYDDIILGSGKFSKVCKAKIIRMDIGAKHAAAKMMNPDNMTKIGINGLLLEIKLLSHVGQHENIIELLGAHTQNVRIGKVCIFLELCEHGSLDKYLRKMRSQAEEMADSLGYCKNLLHNALKIDKYRWSREICKGMAYLASRHIVHANLAAKNVLLHAEKVAKICNFGLSIRLHDYTNKKMDSLPWRWMSPESLRFVEFNEKSDIWAYGVTLWEVYNLGDKPYAGITYNLSFVEMLEDGERLPEPKYNDENDMFGVMERCWNANPQNRPTFAELHKSF